jgi:hypothetical protein
MEEWTRPWQHLSPSMKVRKGKWRWSWGDFRQTDSLCCWDLVQGGVAMTPLSRDFLGQGKGAHSFCRVTAWSYSQKSPASEPAPSWALSHSKQKCWSEGNFKFKENGDHMCHCQCCVPSRCNRRMAHNHMQNYLSWYPENLSWKGRNQKLKFPLIRSILCVCEVLWA